jgi:beta-galactosidase
LQPGEEHAVQFLFSPAADGLYQAGIGNLSPLNIRILKRDKSGQDDAVVPEKLKPLVVLNFDQGQAGYVNDLSGNGNNAKVIGNVKWVDGLFGKAVQTDASQNAYIEIPGNENFDKSGKSKTLTMMCWVYPMDEVNFADILSKGDWNTLQLKGGNTVINYYTGGWEGHESSAGIPEGWNHRWHHLAGVTEGGYLKLYIDGNLAATKKAEPRNPKGETGDHDYSGMPWNIGRNASSPERVFKGYIDDIMLFETALTPPEIFDIMMHVNH